MIALPFWLLLLVTFGTAALDKILGGGVPAWFVKQFEGTILNPFPGSLTLAFYSILLLELATAAAIVAGLARREFQREAPPKFLTAGAFLAQLTFVALCFGQRVSHQFDAAAQLFAYAALTYLASRFALKRG